MTEFLKWGEKYKPYLIHIYLEILPKYRNRDDLPSYQDFCEFMYSHSSGI